MSTNTNNNNAANGKVAGAVVVLFYRYFLPSDDGRNSDDRGDDEPILSADTLTFFQKHKAHYLPLLLRFQSELCRRNVQGVESGGGPKNIMKGRILLSEEGINGTLSCSSKLQLDEYIRAMEEFDLIGDLGLPPLPATTGQEMKIHHDAPKKGEGRFFAGIDWKISFLSGKEEDDVVVNRGNELFPDLKIQMVKEIINTGGLVPVQNVPDQSGKEIPPEEFHDILEEALENDGMVEEEEENYDDEDDVASECENGPPSKKAKHHDIKANGIDTIATKRLKKVKKEVVLIDVRNTFEHAIGHFVHPHSRILTADDANDANCANHKRSNDDGGIDDEKVDAAPGEETSQRKRHSNPGIEEPTPALNPNTVTFSHFDSTFCSRFSSALKDKKVLMYCTGGIRCVKASAMLKSRGVKDVSHLKGGIHRYLERYGSGGFYKGKMFVFDRRRALDPEDLICGDGGGENSVESDGHVGDVIDIHEKDDGMGANATVGNDTKEKNGNNNNTDNSKSSLVGKCIECQTPYDELSGAILCTVCRDLILLCDSCRCNDSNLWEYHCTRHQSWKNAYFTFLDRFSLRELQSQHDQLQSLHDSYIPKENRNVRRTLRKQMDKVLARMDDLKSGVGTVEKNPKRRCRTCFESEDICDGLCWGFWKHSQLSSSSSPALVSEGEGLEPIAKVEVGDRVRPGPNWNEMRLGSRYNIVLKHNRGRELGNTSQNDTLDGDSYNGAKVKVGTVVEVKSWAGGDELDCIAVVWDKDPNDCSSSTGSRRAKRGRGKKKNKDDSGDNAVVSESEIYRWGTLARNGQRMYDVALVS